MEAQIAALLRGMRLAARGGRAGRNAARAGGLMSEAGTACRGGCLPGTQTGACFAEGTLVETPDGLTPIEELQPGDLVAGIEEGGTGHDFFPIERVMVTSDTEVVRLRLGGADDDLVVTSNHPFWRADGWTGALEEGDEVYSSTGDWLRVVGSSPEPETQTVYNLEVAGAHTFFVGDQAAWVHNACGEAPAPGVGWQGAPIDVFEHGGER